MPSVKQQNRNLNRRDSANLKHFTQRTTIHGLYDLVYETSSLFRWIWILVFCVAVFMLIFETTKITQNYLSEPTVSHITTTVPETFPEIIFCPSTHIDPVKARRMGMNRNVFRYYKSMFTWASFFEAHYFHLLFNYRTAADFFTNHRPEIYQIATDFKKFTIKNNLTSMITLMEKVSFDAEDVFGIIHQMHEPNMSVSNKFLLNHICYKVQDHTVYTEMEITHVNLQFYINDLERVFPPYDEHDMLYIGQGMGVAPFGSISVAPSLDYSISLTTMNFRKENLRRKSCKPNSIYAERDMCALTCLNRDLCQHMANCTFTMPEHDNISQICSMFSPVSCIGEFSKHKKLRQKVFKNCYDGCPKPCDMWLYQVVVTPTKRANNMTKSHFRIKYADPSNSMQVIEVLTETWSSLLSSIGGTFSLWIGASLISFVQLCTFVCTAACRQKSCCSAQQPEIVMIEPAEPEAGENYVNNTGEFPPKIKNDFSDHSKKF